MTDEAEKVINLSLCKMASSRAFKKEGSSLHKHLLISSVLTKARSVYFENWYFGDSDISSPSNSTSSTSNGLLPNIVSFSSESSPEETETTIEDIEEDNNIVIEPIILPGQCDHHRTNFKRRRGWSADEDEASLHAEFDEIEEEEEDDDDLIQNLPDDLNEKLKMNGVSVKNMAKRLRFSSTNNNNNNDNNSSTIDSTNDQQQQESSCLSYCRHRYIHAF